MKPPSRDRILPSRFLPLRRIEPIRKILHGWSVKEQQKLRRGLTRQRWSNSELDLLALRKNVPSRTLLEIQSLVKFLKTRVLWRVHQQVRKQRCEERRTKAPIEIWAELAQKMADVHEETISSAFSQMLVIAATEPCSRQNSDPLCSFNTPSPVDKHKCTLPRRCKSTSSSPVIIQPGGTCKPVMQSPGNDGTLSPSSNNIIKTSSFIPSSSVSSTAESLNCPQPSGSVAGPASLKPPSSSMPKSKFCQPTSSHTVSKPRTQVSSTSAASTATVSCSSSSNRPNKQKTVDFEKIYQFMSNIYTKNHHVALTAMENAVLLDLLMSLPEELPLLDCKELRHHLLQVHTRLSAPSVNAVSVPRTDQSPVPATPAAVKVTKQPTVDQHAKGTDASLPTHNVKTAAAREKKGGVVSKPGNSAESPVAEGEGSSQSSAENASKDGGSWAETGLFPLNPFMVPIGLLKRKES